MAAQTPEPEQPTFVETVDVQLVNVEVWVTDQQGNRVTGLTAEDFEIREDGKPVPITNFYEARALAPPRLPARDDRGASSAPAGEPARQPAEPRQQGFLTLYFDELFSRPEGRAQLIEDLRAFLELREVPAERILVLRQDQGLRVEANFGSTPAQIEAALERLEAASARGIQTWADERNAFRRLQQEWELEATINANGFRDPCQFFPRKAISLIQPQIEASRVRIAETLEHLTATAGFLAGLPGPKTLIYISDGLALSPGKDLLAFVKAVCPGQQDDRRLDYLDGLGEPFRRLSRHASANRVTIYTIQSLGLRSNLSTMSAETRGVSGTVRATSRYDSESRIQQRQGMSFLADQTGGRAIYNRNSFLAELEQIAGDMSSFYSLAYAPRHNGDGREHEIEVRVKGGNLRVRHRPGYRDKSADERFLERVESALYLGVTDNPLGVRLGAGAAKVGKNGALTVPFHVRVPADRVAFLPQRGRELATLQVVALARDESRAELAFKREGYRLARPEGAAGDGVSMSLVIELELEAGLHVLGFGVRDEATRTASFVTTAIELKGPAESGSGR